MIDRLSRLDEIKPAWLNSFRWNDIVAGGTARYSLNSPAAMPAGPFRTRSLNTSKRDACARAPRARTAFAVSIFPIISKWNLSVKREEPRVECLSQLGAATETVIMLVED